MISKYLRHLSWLAISWGLISCAHVLPLQEEPKELSHEENQVIIIEDDPPVSLSPDLELLKAEMRQELMEELSQMFKNQILPEMQALSPVPARVRESQRGARQRSQEKSVLGRIEWVSFENDGFKVRARVDTGAQTCSMHAENIQEQIIDGEKYVQFETFDEKGNRHVLLKRVVTSTSVTSSTGATTERYVVKKRVTLGGRSHEVNVNLNNRSGLRYRFLIGRNLLMGNYVVDVSQSRVMGR